MLKKESNLGYLLILAAGVLVLISIVVMNLKNDNKDIVNGEDNE